MKTPKETNKKEKTNHITSETDNNTTVNGSEKIIKAPTLMTKILITLGIFFFILLVAFTSSSLFGAEDSLFSELKEFSKDYFFYSLKSKQGKIKLKGEENDRINLLMLGMGGKGHDGGTLTDTIIIASYKPSTNEISLLSLPRDLIVYVPNYAWRKINHLYYFGNLEKEDYGADFTKDFISKMLGIPIHYYVTVDFASFIEAIDHLDGIEVDVEHTIDDYMYPIKGMENAYPISSRYEHLYIPKGLQKMDGDLALKYVRSRHSINSEGTDYARSRRQQKVLKAVKEKVLSIETVFSPTKIKKLLDTAKKNVQTNVEFDEVMRAVSFGRKLNTDNIITKVIDASPTGPLVENSYNGGFVLETKTGDFTELKFIAQNIFNPESNFADTQKPLTKENTNPTVSVPVTREEKPTTLTPILPVSEDKLTIEIRNGTLINGFAGKISKKFEEAGYEILDIGNAQKHNYLQSIAYNVNNIRVSTKFNNLLKNTLGVNQLTDEIPPALAESNADILIILGSDTFYDK